MNQFHHVLSVVLLICCASGCTATGLFETRSPTAPHLSAEYRSQILATFPNVKLSPATLSFAQSITDEVTARLLHDSPARQFTVDVVDSDQVLSFSYPGGIVISTGLIRRMPNESMFAFVLAHEIAHQRFEHTSSNELAAYALKNELNADRHAVALLASAAYDVRAAPETLTALGSALHGQQTDLDVRRVAIRDFISISKWGPPGTVSRRVYQELHAALGR